MSGVIEKNGVKKTKKMFSDFLKTEVFQDADVIIGRKMDEAQTKRILEAIQKASMVEDFRSAGYLAGYALTVMNGVGKEVDIALSEIDVLIEKIEIAYEALKNKEQNIGTL
ncbi:hypothetical protein AAKU58_004143 [Oxalobacteraceae bacterium GrIS 1.18]